MSSSENTQRDNAQPFSFSDMMKGKLPVIEPENNRLMEMVQTFTNILQHSDVPASFELLPINHESPEYSAFYFDAICFVNRADPEKPRFYVLWLADGRDIEPALYYDLESAHFINPMIAKIGKPVPGPTPRYEGALILPTIHYANPVDILHAIFRRVFYEVTEKGSPKYLSFRDLQSGTNDFYLKAGRPRGEMPTDLLGNPVRHDVVLEFGARTRDGMGANRSVRDMQLLHISGYIELVLVQDPTLVTQAWSVNKPKYQAMFVITAVESLMPAIICTQATVLAAAIVNKFMDSGDWVSVFEHPAAADDFSLFSDAHDLPKWETEEDAARYVRKAMTNMLIPGHLIAMDLPINPVHTEAFCVYQNPFDEYIQRDFGEAIAMINGEEGGSNWYSTNVGGLPLIPLYPSVIDLVSVKHAGMHPLGTHAFEEKFDVRSIDQLLIHHAVNKETALAFADSYLKEENQPNGRVGRSYQLPELHKDAGRRYRREAQLAVMTNAGNDFSFNRHNTAVRYLVSPRVIAATETAMMKSGLFIQYNRKVSNERPALDLSRFV
jgi:hypothetical protein